MSEVLSAIVLLILPLAGLVWLIAAWLSGRQSRGRGSSLPNPPAMSHVSSAVNLAVSAASRTMQTLSVIATSVVAQAGTVAHSAVHACGFVVARFRGLDDAPLIRVEAPGSVMHRIAVNGSYELTVQYQHQAPESYGGAKVNPVELPQPVRVEIVVEGERLDVSGEGTMDVGPNAKAVKTFGVRPISAGKTALRIGFYYKNSWVQRLDLALDVAIDPENAPPEAEAALPGGVGVAMAQQVESSLTMPAFLPREERDLLLDLALSPGPGHTYRARASMRGSSTARPLELPCREADLAEINLGLREALEDLRRYLGDRVELPEEDAAAPEYLETIDVLARRGNDALKRLFPAAEDREYIANSLARAEGGLLEVATDACFLPWELLYAPYDSKNVKLENFWGFRYIVTRVLTNVRQRPSPVASAMERPKIAVFANPELPFAIEHELGYFRKLAQEGAIELKDWTNSPQSASGATAQDRRSAFFEFCGGHESDVAHFACHAVAKEYSRDSYIELSSDLRVRLEDMSVEDYRLSGSPFVFMNACGTGVRDPSKTSDFVRSFLLSGGRGMVATECDVPDRFASVFIEDLYARILDGESIARSLLATRRDFLTTRRNPLGLIYSAYLPVEARLDRANGAN